MHSRLRRTTCHEGGVYPVKTGSSYSGGEAGFDTVYGGSLPNSNFLALSWQQTHPFSLETLVHRPNSFVPARNKNIFLDLTTRTPLSSLHITSTLSYPPPTISTCELKKVEFPPTPRVTMVVMLSLIHI